MDVKFYQRWDHVANTIEVPPELRFFGPDTPTSLELLQQVLHTYQERKQGQNQRQQQEDNCFVPNLQHTRKLAQDIQRRKGRYANTRNRNSNSTDSIDFGLPFPVLNMGFPKCGSTSITRWFRNTGHTASHYVEKTIGFVGPKMLEAVHQGWSPFALLPQRQVYAQMDYTSGDDVATATGTTATTTTSGSSNSNRNSDSNDHDHTAKAGPTVFPQIQLLDEIHAVEPNATFILVFRPVEHWVASAKAWNRYPFRWAESDIPGLVLTDEQRYDRDVLGEKIVVTEEQLKDWWCTHVLHIREFVKTFPSHTLIELDLYDGETSSELLGNLFDVNHTVSWGKTNSNPKAVDVSARVEASHKNSGTSLQVLQEVMQHLDISNDDDDNNNDHHDDVDHYLTNDNSSCFHSDPSHGAAAVHTMVPDPSTSFPWAYPILNVGLPMDPWNDALKEFFSCLGLRVTHRKGQGGKFGSTGKKINQAVQAGLLPLSSYFGPRDVYTHMDYTATLDTSVGVMEERSVFPQIQLLDEIHQEVPNATFLLPFPRFDQWLDFAQSFHNFTERWARMEMPGLVLTEEQKAARSLPCPLQLNEEGITISKCGRLTDMQLKQWWCGHVRHIRKLVNNVYPSHTLLELDLSDYPTSKSVLQNWFPNANDTCLSMIFVAPRVSL
jgi:hypothetical protein